MIIRLDGNCFVSRNSKVLFLLQISLGLLKKGSIICYFKKKKNFLQTLVENENSKNDKMLGGKAEYSRVLSCSSCS